MRLKSWATPHPVAAYLVLALAWSFSIWSLLFLVIAPGGMVRNPPSAALLIAVVGGVGPSLSGRVLTRYLYGRAGSAALKARLRHWRVGWWWLALLVIPALLSVHESARHRLRGWWGRLGLARVGEGGGS